MSRMFQPAPICGGCRLYRKAERDSNKVLLKPSKCAVDATPEYTNKGWFCEEYTKKKNGKKKIRKNKPWQDRS